MYSRSYLIWSTVIGMPFSFESTVLNVGIILNNCSGPVLAEYFTFVPVSQS